MPARIEVRPKAAFRTDDHDRLVADFEVVVSTIAAEIDGDNATSTASWLLFRDTNGIPSLVGVGQYRDRLRRDANGWRIASRVITRDQG